MSESIARLTHGRCKFELADLANAILRDEMVRDPSAGVFFGCVLVGAGACWEYVLPGRLLLGYQPLCGQASPSRGWPARGRALLRTHRAGRAVAAADRARRVRALVVDAAAWDRASGATASTLRVGTDPGVAGRTSGQAGGAGLG